jgi:hypothetical protein
MGGAASIVVASEMRELVALVAWSPGALIHPFVPSTTEFIEEGSQLAPHSYWREASEAKIAERFESIVVPVYLVFGTADHLVDEANRMALIERAKSHHRVDVFEDMVHSAWPVAHADDIIQRSCDFLGEQFAQRASRA